MRFWFSLKDGLMKIDMFKWVKENEPLSYTVMGY